MKVYRYEKSSDGTTKATGEAFALTDDEFHQKYAGAIATPDEQQAAQIRGLPAYQIWRTGSGQFLAVKFD